MENNAVSFGECDGFYGASFLLRAAGFVGTRCMETPHRFEGTKGGNSHKLPSPSGQKNMQRCSKMMPNESLLEQIDGISINRCKDR